MKKVTIKDESVDLTVAMHSLDCSHGNDFSISISEGSKEYYLLTGLRSNSHVDIQVGPEAILELSILADGNLDNTKITANLKKSAQITAYFADFSQGQEKLLVSINLLEENAKAFWHLASLSANDDRKEFDINMDHLSPRTIAISDNYGVCKDASKLIFSGCSSIQKGSKESKTRQNAKIMIFDPACDGVAKPVLKIDEKDIEASHGAVVGKINDEHLFYLTSRGLDENQAKRLITYGYLKPIVKGFREKGIQEEIISLIERRM